MVFGCSFGKVEGFSGLDVFVEEVRFGGYDIWVDEEDGEDCEVDSIMVESGELRDNIWGVEYCLCEDEEE